MPPAKVQARYPNPTGRSELKADVISLAQYECQARIGSKSVLQRLEDGNAKFLIAGEIQPCAYIYGKSQQHRQPTGIKGF